MILKSSLNIYISDKINRFFMSGVNHSWAYIIASNGLEHCGILTLLGAASDIELCYHNCHESSLKTSQSQSLSKESKPIRNMYNKQMTHLIFMSCKLFEVKFIVVSWTSKHFQLFLL